MSAIDRDAVAQLVEDISLADARRIVTVFREDLRRLLPLAERAAAEGDVGNWKRTLHSIAGASGALGGVALEAAARRGMAVSEDAAQALPGDAAALRRLAEATVRELYDCLNSLVDAQ